MGGALAGSAGVELVGGKAAVDFCTGRFSHDSSPDFGLNGKGCKRRIAGCSPKDFTTELIVRFGNRKCAAYKAIGMFDLERQGA